MHGHVAMLEMYMQDDSQLARRMLILLMPLLRKITASTYIRRGARMSKLPVPFALGRPITILAAGLVRSSKSP